MTGGVALIALGTGFAVWSVLKGKKSKGDILKELESCAYMLTEPSDDPLVHFIQKNLPKKYEHEDVYRTPEGIYLTSYKSNTHLGFMILAVIFPNFSVY